MSYTAASGCQSSIESGIIFSEGKDSFGTEDQITRGEFAIFLNGFVNFHLSIDVLRR